MPRVGTAALSQIRRAGWSGNHEQSARDNNESHSDDRQDKFRVSIYRRHDSTYRMAKIRPI
jgi:hypothetical protein